MDYPLLYELNTRCWLRELSTQAGAAVTLNNVPDAEFDRWQRLGFTHVWLMGVWATGPRSRAHALHDPHLRADYSKILPDWTDRDVGGSPYAIAEYHVPRALGGESGLANFRRRLHQRGLKLVLDFVPNHLGLDHPWVIESPHLFVRGLHEAPDTFPQKIEREILWLGHGKDPYFPAWIDTAQLDYRRPDTQTAMTQLLRTVAARCDGLRCDMAMLLLADVFAKTWENYPSLGPTTDAEFWLGAIAAVREDRPDFLFLAEVYWDLEARLQAMGFDFTYDKWLYDHLAHDNHYEAQDHLLEAAPEFLARSAHFLENHDEQRIITWLTPAEHRAAALLVLGLPGMRLLHEGQLTGAAIKTPVQLSRRPAEPPHPEVFALYQYLLTALPVTAVGRGEARLLRPRAAWMGNSTASDFILVQWQRQPDAFDLVVVNLAAHSAQCYVPLEIAGLEKSKWQLDDLLGTEKYLRGGAELRDRGLYLDVPANAAQLFHARRAG